MQLEAIVVKFRADRLGHRCAAFKPLALEASSNCHALVKMAYQYLITLNNATSSDMWHTRVNTGLQNGSDGDHV